MKQWKAWERETQTVEYLAANGRLHWSPPSYKIEYVEISRVRLERSHFLKLEKQIYFK